MNMLCSTQGVSPDALSQFGQNWYIENVFEELDSPREWFFNESSHMLFYQPNTSAIGPDGMPSGSFVGTNLKVLFNITGDQTLPATNITIAGLTLRDTQYTYMDPHGFPSGTISHIAFSLP